MWKKKKWNENPVTNSEHLFENDGEILGNEDNDSLNSLSGDNDGESENCFPVGNIGYDIKKDSLPKSSIILNNYELIFEATKIIERKVGTCKKNNSNVKVQKAFGTLSLNKIQNNLEKINIISVDAISGSGGNGCIPNNNYSPDRKPMKYYVGNLTHSLDFHDGNIHQENGIWVANSKENAWKLFIYEDFINRGLFRIHPTTMNNGEPSSNDGCISPYPSENSVAFHNEIEKILLKRNYVIPLFVQIEGNFNITVQRKQYQKNYVP